MRRALLLLLLALLALLLWSTALQAQTVARGVESYPDRGFRLVPHAGTGCPVVVTCTNGVVATGTDGAWCICVSNAFVNVSGVGSTVPNTRTITAGAGMTGGGDLSANRTLDVVANADGSIVANDNNIQVGVLASDAQHGNRGGGGLHANAVAAGAAGFMTGADKTKLDGIEALADVTDAANVDAAGAVMESDYNANTILAATSDNTPAALTVDEQRLVGRITAGAITGLNATEIRTLINVADGADSNTYALGGAPAGFLTTGTSNVECQEWVYNATDAQNYKVCASNADNQTFEIVFQVIVPSSGPSFASTAVSVAYKLSDGADGNGAKLRVRGTDGATCLTSSAGTSTSEATITATSGDLASCVKTAGAPMFVSIFADSLDTGDSISIGAAVAYFTE